MISADHPSARWLNRLRRGAGPVYLALVQAMEAAIRRFAESQGVKLGQVAQPLRVALSGSTVSPGIFEVLSVLGPAETKHRLLAVAG